MKLKLSREQLKALRREGAKYPRILGYVVMPLHNYNAPIIGASFDGRRLYTVWMEGDSATDLRWEEEDPRTTEMAPARKPGLWEWR
jgi:hypothetical protein